jgi:acetyl esterase/lipase
MKSHVVRTIVLGGLCVALFRVGLGAQDPGKPKSLPLWSDGAPGALGKEARDNPTVIVYLPTAEKANGAAVVICPGGGYGALARDHEGHQVARWLNSLGVAGIILEYRLGPRYHHPIEMHDVQRALRFSRAHASEWKIDPERVGILGFSAGGHLASTAGTHFDAGKTEAADPINRHSCRPDFMILVYPVITLKGPYAHNGSRINLLGKYAADTLVESLCNEKQVTPQTPPTFLVHTTEDKGVPPENSILFYQALRKAKVPAEMHIYEKGNHGLGLGTAKGLPFASWPERCAAWMNGRGVLARKSK